MADDLKQRLQAYGAVFRDHPDIQDQTIRLLGSGETTTLFELLTEMFDLMAEAIEGIRDEADDRIEALEAEVVVLKAEKAAEVAHADRLADGLFGIRVYASDTLSGPSEGKADVAWYVEGVTEIQTRALAAQPAAHDRAAQAVPPELHRSFPDAGDGRPMPPMGDELMTAGLNAEDARFVAVQLAQNGMTLVQTVPDAELDALREELRIYKEHADDMSRLNECCCGYDKPSDLCKYHKKFVDAAVEAALRARTAQPVGVRVTPLIWEASEKDPDAIVAGDYEIVHEGHGYQLYFWSVVLGDEHRNRAEAEAAAWEHHQKRILSAVVIEPVIVQDAAKVLLADPDALLDMAVAHDREDAALIGEPNPWDAGADPEWMRERIGCVRAALTALLPDGGA